ncbi:uncharacterized protein BcabD6B2_13930 [Babesia caballi]|uniref:Integral membrane protein n=1 Tax=Babesia caballi TaxID=5871 RepID=A0AAV4LPT3_BABCB|nr:integral membrane protein [Babesia caballi]
MSTVGSLVKNKKENIVGRDITLIRGQGSVEHGRADGVAAGENAKIATLKTIFTPHSIILIGVNLVLTIILIICYFKTVRNVDTIKAMSNVLNQPFRVTAKKHVLTGILSTDRVKLGAQTKSDIVSIGVQHVKSVKSLSIWFKRVVPLVSAIKQICLVANRYGDKAQYVHLDPGKIDGVMAKFKTLQLNVVLIFQTSDADIIYTKLEFGRDFNGAALIDNSSFYSISTKKDILSLVFIVLQIFALMLHLYFDLKTASVFGNRKNILQADVKVKTRISLLIIMCAIDIIHFIGNSVLNFNIPDINDSAAKSRDFDPMVALFERVPSIHKMGKFCIFVNTIFLICYVVTMMPRYCYSFTDNGEIVKQLIFTSANTMAVVLYQYFLLLVSWSIIGNRFFGGSVEHLRNFFTALRYNVIVGFNKFLVHPMSKYLDFYNDVTVMLFYNVGLTSILAIYYFSSLKKKKAVPLETFDKHQDNFRADITVNMDDLVGFKVLVKSVEEHKKFMGTNVTEVDYCKQFFERFPQNTPLGFTRISPKRQVHSCLERIKKYLLCILLLRMRVRNLSLKIGDIDQRSQQRNPINEHKRIYLSMLKEKLHITVEEIERFKRSTEILLAGKGMPGISKVNNADGGATNMGKDGGDRTSDNQDSPLYDISELEKFVMCPVPSDNVIPNTHLVKESGVNVDGPPFNLTDLQEVGETQIYMNREPIEVASETDAGKVHKETASQSSWTSDHPMTIGMAEKVTGKSIDGPNGDGDSRLVHRGIVDNSTTRNASQQDASHQAFFTHGAERVRDGSNGDVAQIYSKIGSLVSSNVEVVAKKSQDIKPDVRDISKSQERVGIDKSRNFNITSNPLESNKTGDLKSDHATPEETESLFEFTDEVRPNTSADAAGCSSQTSVTDNVPCHPDSDKGEKDMFDPLNNECLYKTSVDGALNVVAGTTEGKSKSSDVASSKPRFDKSGQMNATADDKNSGEFYATKGKIGIFRASVLGQK